MKRARPRAFTNLAKPLQSKRSVRVITFGVCFALLLSSISSLWSTTVTAKDYLPVTNTRAQQSGAPNKADRRVAPLPPRLGPPAANLPNLGELRSTAESTRNNPSRVEAPAPIPSTLRSRRKPVVWPATPRVNGLLPRTARRSRTGDRDRLNDARLSANASRTRVPSHHARMTPPTPQGPSGLKGHWKFDENSGPTAADSSGNNNTGTLTGGASWGSGQSGAASSFDGVNAQVQVGAQSSLVMNNTLSVSGWMYPTGPGATYGGVLVSKEGEYQICRFPDGKLNWALANASPGWAWVDTGYVVPLNQWTHVALTYDNGVAKTYVNGTLVHTLNGSGAIGDHHPSENDFRIGGRQLASYQNFQGRIDDVRVYNRALTASEVSFNPGPSASDFAMARLDPKNRTGIGGEDLLSNNFNWSLPLIGLSGRGLDLGLTLSYNSLVWTRSGNYIGFDLDQGSIAPGFRLGFPIVEGPYWNSQANANFYLLVTPSGARIELRQLGNSIVYESKDSTTYNSRTI
jgi:hypothetical protein